MFYRAGDGDWGRRKVCQCIDLSKLRLSSCLVQLAQNIDDAHSMAKVMAHKNHKAKMHSILAMTPDEIDAMIERVQGGTFS